MRASRLPVQEIRRWAAGEERREGRGQTRSEGWNKEAGGRDDMAKMEDGQQWGIPQQERGRREKVGWGEVRLGLENLGT